MNTIFESQDLNDNSIMEFGKYKGHNLANVPEDWLRFWYQCFDKSTEYKKKLRAYIYDSILQYD